MKTIFSSLILVFLVSTLNIATSVAQDSSIYMYWTDPHDCKIQRANLDGANVVDLVLQVCGDKIAVDVAGGKMYWTDVLGNRLNIRRANLDGANVEDLVIDDQDVTRFVSGLALDVAEGKMYWAQDVLDGSKIRRANLNGTNIQDIVLLSENSKGLSDINLDLARRKLYWAVSNKIYRANLDGSNKEKIYDQLHVFSIALDVADGKIYYSGHYNGDGIHYFDMTDKPGLGGVYNIQTLVRDDGASDLALHLAGGKMYWAGSANYNDGRQLGVHSVNLDGTNQRIVVTAGTAEVRNTGSIALGIPQVQPDDGLHFIPSEVADQTFTVGTAISLTLPSATGGTAPYTYTLSAIPIGLQFDAATQLLSGTPTTPGTTNLTYTATDAAGATAALTFSITVTSSGGGIAEPRPVPPDVRQIFGLDPFYQQYIDVGGLPVVASVQTNPYALKETAWLIQQMIGHRPDVLQALGQNRVRFSVMAYTEMTTQIPEHSDLIPGFYWDIRARGLGATSQRPAVSCGEENLLQYPGDPYWNENVLVHEFSHALHEMGLNTIDASFDNRLSEAFRAAMAQGLWQGTYASTNKQEYWAEGAQSWFNTNRENDVDHNAINTRAELKVYDLGLAALLTEIFGDNEWRYTLPDTRMHLPHLQGFNPQASPTFQWPADSLVCYQQLTDPEINSCGDKWVHLEAHPPSGLPGLKSPGTSTLSAIIFVNRTGTTVSYYWIDFDGNERFYGRFGTEHAIQQSFVGHIWLVKDDTGKNLAVFHAVEQTGRAIISATDRIFISPISPQTFEVGTDVQLTLPAATGGTAPYTYSLSALPAGLNFDAGTRVISGTPTTATPATPVTYTVTDATGQTASLTFTIEVTGGTDNLDVNGDGQVNILDLILVAVFYGTRGDGLPADVNADGIVNVLDFAAVAAGVDAAGALPLQAVEAALRAAAAQAGDIEAIAGAPTGFDAPQHAWSRNIAYRNVANALAEVRHLAASDARLGKTVMLLAELLQLLKEMNAIPETTALLPNYPNPFNPETWIPYHLETTEAEVTLTIYNVRGDVVRTLMLGHQSAGVYESRGRAAYWDGRNRIGEPVASGVYFYTLTAGDFTATRKLLIAK